MRLPDADVGVDAGDGDGSSNRDEDDGGIDCHWGVGQLAQIYPQ